MEALLGCPGQAGLERQTAICTKLPYHDPGIVVTLVIVVIFSVIDFIDTITYDVRGTPDLRAHKAAFLHIFRFVWCS